VDGITGCDLSRRVRLLLRHCLLKGVQLRACGIDALNRRVIVQRHFPASRVVHLRHQAQIGQARRIAVAIAAGVLAVRQHRFQRLEAGGNPVPHPIAFLFVVRAKLRTDLLQYAQIAERMNVASDHLRQSTHASTLRRIRWQQCRLRMSFIKVFDHGHGLRDHAIAIDQGRHQFLRIDCDIAGRMLFAAVVEQVHCPRFVTQTL